MILAKKSTLANLVQEPMALLADRCATVWSNPDYLDEMLLRSINDIPHCHLLYAWTVEGIEVSSIVRPDGCEPQWRGRDLSQRPYLTKRLPFKGVMLSSVYLSEHSHKRCITALQAVSRGNELLGFIAADFHEQDLPLDEKMAEPVLGWQQYRGDPAVRGTLFMQQRAQSLADDQIDDVIELIDSLMREHGVFHSRIHFSSSRCMIWLYNDPYRYQLLGIDETIDPDTCLAYPLRPYPEQAIVALDKIRPVLDQFKALRFADETIYLRVGSINVINGMIGLTFSCDGSHYMPVAEFLNKNLAFWLGSLSTKATIVSSNHEEDGVEII